MTEENNINYHEIIYNLKLLKNEAKKINTVSEWEIFLAKLNKYIFSNAFITTLYIGSVNTFADLNEERKIFTNKLIKNYINFEVSNDSYLTINYFESKTQDLSEDTLQDHFYNIFDMYFKISKQDLKNLENGQFIWQYQTFIDNLDCFVLSYISRNSLFFKKENAFKNLYLNSMFNGIYHYLHNWTMQTIHETYYNNENIKKIFPPAIIQTDKLNGKPAEVFHRLCKGDSVPVIATKMNISESTVRTHINTCCTKLNLPESGIECLTRFILTHNNYDNNMT